MSSKSLLTKVKSTLREESNPEKSPAEQKNAELKNANLVQNSHSFIPHFSRILDHSHSFIPHFSGILDHSQSFIPHFLNSRLHFFPIYFSFLSKKFTIPSVATLANEANRK